MLTTGLDCRVFRAISSHIDDASRGTDLDQAAPLGQTLSRMGLADSHAHQLQAQGKQGEYGRQARFRAKSLQTGKHRPAF